MLVHSCTCCTAHCILLAILPVLCYNTINILSFFGGVMGKLIVLEGTDGSGKSTQFARLTDHLDRDGYDFRRLVFPRYENPSSSLLRMYLGGEFGSHPSDVNPYAASTFFTVDRFASWCQDWGGYYKNGGLVFSDRYTTSNAVHQASKLPQGEREAFFGWLYDFEFNKIGLPKPDMVIFLDVPISFTEQLMRRRESDTGTHADIHEQDLEYLRICRETASQAAAFYGWRSVSCTRQDELRTIEDIHDEIYSIVRSCIG